MKRIALLIMAVVYCACMAWAQSIYDKPRPMEQKDTVVMEDTLRELVVKAPRSIYMPMSKSMQSELKLNAWQQKYSLGGILQRKAPLVQDYIMHPFGFAERKKNKKRQKVSELLEEYDRIDPFYHQLDSIMELEGVTSKK